jgi:phasin family protein
MTPEQLAAAQKASLDAFVELARKSFEGIERLTELNLQVARATMGESADQARALLDARDAQQLATLQAGLVQPATEKASTYSRQVYEITSSTQAEVTRVVEAQMAAAQERILAMVDTVLKNAPAGGEQAASIVKTAVTTANAALESVQQAARQAASVAESNMETLAQAVPAPAPRKASRKSAARG